MEELQPFLLDEVSGIEEDSADKWAVKESYSLVFDVKVRGATCKGKRLHDTSLEKGQISAVERENLADKFREECVTLSKLRHPNIVQFIGVHCGKWGLTLITEKLGSDLEEFMETHPNIVLPLKISILLDISYGLLYLHEYNPPVIHHNLMARHIFISDRCQAKIADSSGVAKTENGSRHSQQTPEEIVYMPPEAFTVEASVTPKLDIFSFGHLSLYLSIQDTPKVYDSQDSPCDPHPIGEVELHRRRKSLRELGRKHTLYPIVVQCLLDQPERRPTSRDINTELSYLARSYPCTLKVLMDVMQVCQPMSSKPKSLLRQLRSNTDPEVLANNMQSLQPLQPLPDLKRLLSSEDNKLEDVASLEDLENLWPTKKQDVQHSVQHVAGGPAAENTRTVKTCKLSLEQSEVKQSVRESYRFSAMKYEVSESSHKSSNEWEDCQTDLLQKAAKDMNENQVRDDGSSQHIDKSLSDKKPCPPVATVEEPDDSSGEEPRSPGETKPPVSDYDKQEEDEDKDDIVYTTAGFYRY